MLIDRGEFDVDGSVPILWALYLYCLSNIVEMPNWRQLFEQASVRSRFNYSDFNRNALFNGLDISIKSINAGRYLLSGRKAWRPTKVSSTTSAQL